MDILHNLFIPHSKNNHRSKLLHNTSLFIFILLLLSVSAVFRTIERSNPEILGISYSISENALLTLVNNERAKQNLPPLSLNENLSTAAHGKAQHMFANNYWAHFADDGTTPWDFIKKAGYNYVSAGENLAKGFTEDNDIVQAWMNSPSHRDNILSPKYKDIGFAIVEGNMTGEDTVLVVEMFGAQDVPIYAANTPLTAKSSETQKAKVRVLTESQSVVMQEASRDSSKQSEIQSAVSSMPLIDIQKASKTIAFVFLGMLLFTLIVDLVIVERKKIPRLIGHNLDHILLISLFILFLLIEKNGGIL